MPTINRIVSVVAGLFLHLLCSHACDNTTDISPCTCSYLHTEKGSKIKVDCSGYGLRSVPNNLPQQTAVLDFSDNLLQPGNVDSLCKYELLERVSIAGNHLAHIDPRSRQVCQISQSLNFSGNSFETVSRYTIYGLELTQAFYGLEARTFNGDTLSRMAALTELDIIMHQTRIPTNIFKGTSLRLLTMEINGATEYPATILQPISASLNEFTLRSSTLKALPKRLLSRMKKLNECNLHMTALYYISSRLFQQTSLFRSLTNISLSGIKSLPRRVFWNLEALRHLSIHSADVMPSDLFKGLFELYVLDLFSCAINRLPSRWFDDLCSLNALSLRNIGLTAVRRRHFLHLEALERLDLSNNELRALEAKLFHGISSSIKHVDISENILKIVPGNLFKEHSVLESLDLSNNQIYTIENGAFDHLLDLKWLYLQNNKLYDLEADIFVYSVNMAYLDMSSNILIDLSGELFDSTQKLLELDLSDNRIYNLNRSIPFNTPALRDINLSHNPIECDCGTVEVKKLLSHVHLIGDCAEPQAGIAIVAFVPDTNCSSDDATELYRSDFNSAVDFKPPSESESHVHDNRHSELIIDGTSLPQIDTTVRDSHTLTYLASEPSHSEINNLTTLNKNAPQPNSEAVDSPINRLPVSKHDVLDSRHIFFTTSKVNGSIYGSEVLDSPIHNLTNLIANISLSFSESADSTEINSTLSKVESSIGILGSWINNSTFSRETILRPDTVIITSRVTKSTIQVVNNSHSGGSENSALYVHKISPTAVVPLVPKANQSHYKTEPEVSEIGADIFDSKNIFFTTSKVNGSIYGSEVLDSPIHNLTTLIPNISLSFSEIADSPEINSTLSNVESSIGILGSWINNSTFSREAVSRPDNVIITSRVIKSTIQVVNNSHNGGSKKSALYIHNISSTAIVPLVPKANQSNYITEPEVSEIAGNKEISHSHISARSHLEPSFTTADVYSVKDYAAQISSFPIEYSTAKTISATPQPTIFIGELPTSAGLQSHIGLKSILPTRSSTGVGSEVNDDSTMTHVFHNSQYDSIETSQNETVHPKHYEITNTNTSINLDAKKSGTGEKSDYFYHSLAFILSVAIFSLLILVFLYYRKRRSTLYEMQNTTDIFNRDNSFQDACRASPNPLRLQTKEVPSIQIESVDDDGNIKVEIYPGSDT